MGFQAAQVAILQFKGGQIVKNLPIFWFGVMMMILVLRFKTFEICHTDLRISRTFLMNVLPFAFDSL